MPPNPICEGGWELIGHLGQGGFGEVKHWRNRKTNQEVATKHIKDDIKNKISADQENTLKNRWKQEYEWSRMFKKSFIVAGVELGRDSEAFITYLNSHHIWRLPVIILEYCNGGDVRKHLERPENANGLMEVEVCEIMRTLRLAIDFLHNTCKICHRDLKPDNIVINRLPKGKKVYKLTDFGLAGESPENTMQQSVVGTRHYYAPEVVETGKYKSTVDYWSMGVIIYELITGVLPFIPHQSIFNIHVNIREKKRGCIAITEDYINSNQFHFHNNIPVVHHLSQPLIAPITKWLRVALDNNYSHRGSLGATDEVQDIGSGPVIFSMVDSLLKIKVLTVFVASTYKYFQYEVTPSMTMQQLCKLIENDTKIELTSIFYVLPTGHPHKRMTIRTTPMDLYVEDWRDTSEETRNPPVMVYVFHIKEECTFEPSTPIISETLRYFLDKSDTKLEKWLAKHVVLEMHHLLNTEKALVRMLLLGFMEYALFLEHVILEHQVVIKALDKQKDKLCGAVELFQELIPIAKEQEKIYLSDDSEWQSKWRGFLKNHTECVTSVERIVNHYESTLRSVRVDVIGTSQEINDNILKSDIYELKSFQRNHLRTSTIKTTELHSIAINFSMARKSLIEDTRIQHLREITSKTHLRFSHLIKAVSKADENLRALQGQLLQLQLDLLPKITPLQQPLTFQLSSAVNGLSISGDNAKCAASLDALDSLSASDLISQSMSLCSMVEQSMDVDLN